MVSKVVQDQVLSILGSPVVLSEYPEISDTFLKNLQDELSRSTNETFKKILDIEKTSPGIEHTDNEIKLKEDWGVKLNGVEHSSYISSPQNIRSRDGKFFIANKSSTALGGAVFDNNLNILGTVGSRSDTPDYGVGEFSGMDDFTYSSKTGKFYVVSADDHIIHLFNGNTKAYESSIGDGTAGIPTEVVNKITEPIAIAIGQTHIYVLCKTGDGGTGGSGFVARFTLGHKFVDIPLYDNKNGGNGKIFENEIHNPRDMIVTQKNGRDHLYILNGHDEVGLFDTADWNYKEIYTIPSNFANTNLGLKRITVEGDSLYISSSTKGLVIAIDLKTRKLIGKFGTLKDESSNDSDQTLGFFNGPGGIISINGTIYLTESLNNRVQVFGKALFTQPTFEVIFKQCSLPNSKYLVDISRSLLGKLNTEVRILDKGLEDKEYEVSTAVARKVSSFKVKLTIDPTIFSKKNRVYDVYPVYVMMENKA